MIVAFMLSVATITSAEGKDWKYGVKSGGQKKYTKDNSGGMKNLPKRVGVQKKYYRKTTRYWKYSGADNQGKLEHITESESNYRPTDRYQKW